MYRTAKIVEGYRARVEDRAEIIHTGSGCVLIVADGAGGRSGGAEAAELAIRQLCAAAPALRNPKDCCRCLSEIDHQIQQDPLAGETTAVIVIVSPGGIAGASVGDSGAWSIRPTGYIDLTAGQHPKPGLGTGGARPVPFAARSLDGTLLVASDGLFKYSSPEAISKAALEDDLENAARRLVELVRLPSGSLWDDVSVILCRL